MACDPKTIVLYFIFGLGNPKTIVDGLIVFDIPVELGKALSHLTAPLIHPIVITFGIFLYGVACVIALALVFTVLFDRSINPTFSSLP